MTGRWYKDIDGKRVWFKEPLRIGSTDYFNPFDELMIQEGWTKWIEPEPTPEELLGRVKRRKISEIERYDASSAVNVFYIGNAALWLDKATRAGLMLRFDAEEAAGKVETTLWYDTLCFTLNIAKAREMLFAIEVYASKCFDVTAAHKRDVMLLESVEDVEAYDYKVGYPDKLSFDYVQLSNTSIP